MARSTVRTPRGPLARGFQWRDGARRQLQWMRAKMGEEKHDGCDVKARWRAAAGER